MYVGGGVVGAGGGCPPPQVHWTSGIWGRGVKNKYITINNGA